MNTAANYLETETVWAPSKGVVAMFCLIIAECAIFSIFVVAYLYYLGKDIGGPTPRQILRLPVLNTICLLSSSVTVSMAERWLRKGDTRRFRFWWLATILLGGYFLLGTGGEWHHLIYDKGFTIQTNLFGTTFYSLVGLHASHVVVGLLAMLLVMAFASAGVVKKEHSGRVFVLALYWHFVDVVWIVVFYGRLYHRALTRKGDDMDPNEKAKSSEFISVPGATSWPLVAAFGLTMVLTGLLTHVMVSILGAVTFGLGLVGWFREVLPVEGRDRLAIEQEELVPLPPGRPVRQLEVGENGHRARLPRETYPYFAGVRGGMVGGVAMAVVAMVYGQIAHRSVWYPINLLAAAGSAHISAMSDDQLLAFNGPGLALAIFFHAVTSIAVGLLYGVSLPMFPRRPILLGGILAPLFWSGFLYAGLDVINPALQTRINWGWFMASQFAYGLVAGLVVSRQAKILTMQYLPFAVRARIEGSGLAREEGETKQ